jgi:hypothetical protein
VIEAREGGVEVAAGAVAEAPQARPLGETGLGPT